MRYAAWILIGFVLVVAASSCAHRLRPLPPPGPERYVLQPDLNGRWYVPLMAKNGDYVCVETSGNYPNFCMRVGDLRAQLARQYAD